ncbi:MAG: hypothetical protein F4213_18425 [Boseongicola sp. SB0677_bin_26]|nr:hypothetical protein [Boseongicola sp. SB0665_bin_10]MYG27969.1 hypothetical protein [Boseongicola sp. SB0677_bin_26]
MGERRRAGDPAKPYSGAVSRKRTQRVETLDLGDLLEPDERAGLAIAKRGAGTWFAPNDAMLGQALRVAPVAGLTRPFHSAPSKSR